MIAPTVWFGTLVLSCVQRMRYFQMSTKIKG
jgi:hypothetical protein